MAVARGQDSTLAQVGSGRSVVTSWAAAPLPGSTILVFVQCAVTPSSVTDNGSPPSAFTADVTNANAAGIYVYRANNISLPGSGAYQVTVAISGLHTIQAWGSEYTGVNPGAPDVTARPSGTGTSVSSGAVVPARAGSVIFGGFSDNSVLNPETITFTGSAPQVEQARNTNGSSFWAMAAADALTGSSQTFTWTLGDSQPWSAAFASYSPVAAGTVAVLASGAGAAAAPSAAVAYPNPVSARAAFGILIDWENDGDFTDSGDDVTGRTRESSTLTVAYGRDTARALSPASPGQAAFTLNNNSRDYYPDNTGSPLTGLVATGRPVQVTATQDSAVYTVYRGYLDDLTLSPNKPDRSVAVSCLDLMARFGQLTLSTPLLPGARTGTVVGVILDQLGWPSAARDLDVGGSTFRWWWEEGTDGLTALAEVLAAEGPPSICYIDANTGNFVFRDRHHRLLRAASTASQCTFTNGTSTEAAGVVTFSQPMSYDAGWRNIVNTVQLSVDQRDPAGLLAVVWQSDATIAIAAGQNVTVIAQGSDPFTGAVTPVAGTDFTQQSGTTAAALSRTSGQSVIITLTDSGSGSVISGLQLQAYPVTVSRTVQVAVSDGASVTAYGVRSLPGSTTPAGVAAEDAAAVAQIYLDYYAQPNPIVTIPVANANARRLQQQLARDLSDRIHITDTETGLNTDFFIEQISLTASQAGRFVTTTFGCEKAPATVISPVFQFGVSGAGFDQGKFAK